MPVPILDQKKILRCPERQNFRADPNLDMLFSVVLYCVRSENIQKLVVRHLVEVKIGQSSSGEHPDV
jgi:hypothetical protein